MGKEGEYSANSTSVSCFFHYIPDYFGRQARLPVCRGKKFTIIIIMAARKKVQPVCSPRTEKIRR